MRVFLPAFVLLVFLLAGCAQPKYLVKGLTLPPGATVLNEMESKQVSMQIPLMGEVDKAITVNFDCTGDWDAVAAHIDQAMQKEGYQESMSQLGQMIPGQNPMQDQIMDSMRMWNKSGGQFSVMLMNNKSMMDAAGKGGAMNADAMGSMGMGGYTLTVIKYKGDK